MADRGSISQTRGAAKQRMPRTLYHVTVNNPVPCVYANDGQSVRGRATAGSRRRRAGGGRAANSAAVALDWRRRADSRSRPVDPNIIWSTVGSGSVGGIVVRYDEPASMRDVEVWPDNSNGIAADRNAIR